MAFFCRNEMMRIYLNEQPIEVPADISLFDLRQQRRPDADLLIINGHPAKQDQPLQEDDRVVLIQRGQQPRPDELDALLRARHTPGVHDKIKQSCVGIAGVGGLGSAIAVALTRIGIGKLVIVDYDLVEPSNLNRQQYFIDQIGLPKVTALQENLQRINPGVEIEAHQVKVTPDNICELFGQVDVLAEAFDAAEEKAMLTGNFLSKIADKPLVAGSGMAGYEPSNSIQTERLSDRLILCGDGTTAAEPGRGLMAPRVGIAAHHQANAILRLLLGEKPE
ncbi:sulfur carrier protein ThiS adenylyltransferase ThiF [Malonomonas rubra]|nr:sulfur carrier protein ThiS adenylyltransferase ThiF [Malonomonas rubra]